MTTRYWEKLNDRRVYYIDILCDKCGFSNSTWAGKDYLVKEWCKTGGLFHNADGFALCAECYKRLKEFCRVKEINNQQELQ